MPEVWQRQRHGVSKHLAEGLGGALIGAAAVLLLQNWLGRRRTTAAAAAAGAEPAPAAAAAPATQPKARQKHPRQGVKP